ncbi:hypothetical protein I5L79_23095 [Hymenobacter sp. BT594]|uniref:receptor protein-tyrosine kinase n=1 Tax=Hymenobacter guriensis TaxID=2793065 RepID=A0ABS0L8K9_9BACT|nr:glycine rich domain-containing protein [Hymenobacter guriensis]MBG8556452.1 hypothetical protein [Hymenobacter guriensis]
MTCRHVLSRLSLIVWPLLLTVPAALAQTGGAVGIGTTTPDPSAVLDVSSSSKGLLPPRLTTAQRDGIASPALGLTIYNITTSALNTWDGLRWVAALVDVGSFPTTSTTFRLTGAPQTYTVPAGVYHLQADLAGGAGGAVVTDQSIGQGLGGRVQAVLSVTPGQVLTIYVGGAGGFYAGGYNGGGSNITPDFGGGGASDIRVNGTTLSDRVLVAGGGGGRTYKANGGAGGGLTGGTGQAASDNYGAGTGGTGGSQSGPGAAGAGTYQNGPNAEPGTDNLGGTAGVFGGGGGGGYYGGGGGGYYSGGGGGSSYAGAGTSNVVHTSGYHLGDGYVKLTPIPVAGGFSAPVLDASNFVNGLWTKTGQTIHLTQASNNVGIGTSSPTEKLEVVGNAAVSGSTTVGGNALVSGYLGIGTNLPPAQRLTVDGNAAVSGSVGIGNGIPQNSLDVQSGGRTDSHPSGRALYVTGNFGDASDGAEFRLPNGRMGIGIGANSLYAAGSDANQHLNLMPKGTGNVGIGITSPELKLDVIGAIGLRTESPWDHLYLSHDGTKAVLRAGGAENGLSLQVGNSVDGSYGYFNQYYQEALRLLPDGRVGVGTSSPVSRLANTSADIAASNGYGGGAGSLSWMVEQAGYAALFYNKGGADNSEGVAVKVAAAAATALDVSRQASALTAGTPLLRVLGNGRVGIGVSSPYSQLANTTSNIVGSDGQGGNPGSLAWSANQQGYAAMFYNAGTTGVSNGLAVKVATTAAAALDVSQQASPTATGASLLRVQGNGRVGIGTNTPDAQLDVNGYLRVAGANDTPPVGTVPSVAFLRLTATLATAANTQTLLPHGLTSDAKILSLQVLVDCGNGNTTPPGFTDNAGELYYAYLNSGRVVLRTGAGASSNVVQGKTARILITYEQ